MVTHPTCDGGAARRQHHREQHQTQRQQHRECPTGGTPTTVLATAVVSRLRSGPLTAPAAQRVDRLAGNAEHPQHSACACGSIQIHWGKIDSLAYTFAPLYLGR